MFSVSQPLFYVRLPLFYVVGYYYFNNHHK
ncbi:hypothetical protein VPHD479_0160 [Vibrio phage D479]